MCAGFVLGRSPGELYTFTRFDFSQFLFFIFPAWEDGGGGARNYINYTDPTSAKYRIEFTENNLAFVHENCLLFIVSEVRKFLNQFFSQGFCVFLKNLNFCELLERFITLESRLYSVPNQHFCAQIRIRQH